MTYHAKKPRKKQLRIKIEKCYYVSIVDETETELEVDYCFGTREDAMQCGKQLMDDYLEVIVAEQGIVNPTALIFAGMNNIGGAK